MALQKSERTLKEIYSKQIVNVEHVKEIIREDQLLQQNKADLRDSFCFQERQRLYLKYLATDISTWPDVKETDAKLEACRRERLEVKNKLQEEKDKIYTILQTVTDEHNLVQEKVKKLEEKMKLFESKKNSLSKSSQKVTCEQAVKKIEAEVVRQREEIQRREKDIAKLKAKLKGNVEYTTTQVQPVERLKKIVGLIQDVSGVLVHVNSSDQITLEFSCDTPGTMPVSSSNHSLKLEVTLTFKTDSDGNMKLRDVKITSDHFHIEDLIETAVALNDVPYLVLSIKERWNQQFPLLSEIDTLNKNHVVDWIPDQGRLRVLVGKYGKIMFTLNVTKDYPTTREITLIDYYGIEAVDTEDLPASNSTLHQWVLYLEQKYSDH